MKCPVCKTWTFRLDTRLQPNNTVKRRSECANGHRFVSIEQVIKIIEQKQKGKS